MSRLSVTHVEGDDSVWPDGGGDIEHTLLNVQRPRLAGLEWLVEDPEAVVVTGLMVRETSNTPS